MENNENFEKQQNSNQEEVKSAPNVVIVNQQPAPKTPIYKKWWFWAIIGFVVLAIIIGSSSGNSDDQTDDSGNNGSATSDPTSKNNLGDYNVVIDSCRLARDYEGKPIVIVKYKFTNNSKNTSSFWTTLKDSVFQNGVGLNKCYIAADSANYSDDNQTKEIKSGATIEVEVAYILNDTTTPIEVEVSEYISFNDKKVTKKFTIAN